METWNLLCHKVGGNLTVQIKQMKHLNVKLLSTVA